MALLIFVIKRLDSKRLESKSLDNKSFVVKDLIVEQLDNIKGLATLKDWPISMA